MPLRDFDQLDGLARNRFAKSFQFMFAVEERRPLANRFESLLGAKPYIEQLGRLEAIDNHPFSGMLATRFLDVSTEMSFSGACNLNKPPKPALCIELIACLHGARNNNDVRSTKNAQSSYMRLLSFEGGCEAGSLEKA